MSNRPFPKQPHLPIYPHIKSDHHSITPPRCLGKRKRHPNLDTPWYSLSISLPFSLHAFQYPQYPPKSTPPFGGLIKIEKGCIGGCVSVQVGIGCRLWPLQSAGGLSTHCKWKELPRPKSVLVAWRGPLEPLNPQCHARRLLFHLPYHNRHLPAMCNTPRSINDQIPLTSCLLFGVHRSTISRLKPQPVFE